VRTLSCITSIEFTKKTPVANKRFTPVAYFKSKKKKAQNKNYLPTSVYHSPRLLCTMESFLCCPTPLPYPAGWMLAAVLGWRHCIQHTLLDSSCRALGSRDALSVVLVSFTQSFNEPVGVWNYS
jgi:hypothetical protein